MAVITINVSDRDDAAWACRLVADRIEEGCTGGILGWSADEWNISE